MANIAECAFAVDKRDIQFMNGALRKAENGEISTFITKTTYEHNGDTYELLEKYCNGSVKCRLKKNGEKKKEAIGHKNVQKVVDALRDMKRIGYEEIKDTHVENGWFLDWKKLGSYSYEYPATIHEYDDHITVYFGARWSFPDSLEDKLDEFGVLWQGASCEDGMAYEDDCIGNSDFGLRVKSERQCVDGEYYTQHYVEDTSI